MKEIQGVVYGLFCTCHPGAGVRYVGQTRRGLATRLRGHLTDARAASEGRKPHDYAVYRWIRKHEYRIRATVLDRCCTVEELNTLEVKWITQLGTFGSGSGLNQCAGGGGVRGRSPSAETRKKMSEAQLRRGPRPPEFAAKMGAIVVSARKRPETRARYQDYYSKKGGPAAKITPEQVREIRRIREETGDTYQRIGVRFGLSPNAVSMICRRITWPNLD